MPTLIIIALVVLLPLIFVLLWAIGGYNKLVTLRNRFKNAFAQIDVQLKRRYDLIPNLVETAKGYLKHERETLTAIADERGDALNPLEDAMSRVISDQQSAAAAEGAFSEDSTAMDPGTDEFQ